MEVASPTVWASSVSVSPSWLRARASSRLSAREIDWTWPLRWASSVVRSRDPRAIASFLGLPASWIDFQKTPGKRRRGLAVRWAG